MSTTVVPTVCTAEASLACFRKVCAKSDRAGMFSLEKVMQKMGYYFEGTRVAAGIGLSTSIILATKCSQAV